MIGAAVSGAGALLPDLDHPRSKASRSLPRELFGEALQVMVPILTMIAFFWIFGGSQTGRQMLGAFAPVLKVCAWLLIPAVVLALASWAIRLFTGHRGATHSLVFAGIAVVAAVIVCLALKAPWWYGLLIGWGWLTHLAADATTHMGVPSLLWPFAREADPV